MNRSLSSLALISCFATAAIGQTVVDPDLRVDTVVGSLGFATGMEFVADDEILVLLKTDGRVLHVVGGVLQPGQVLDVHVNSLSERGLLGIARDPGFDHNGHVYLYYTEASGFDGGNPLGNRVYRYTWTGSALVDPRLILDLPWSTGPNHDGGIVTFGTDDRLYAVIGDLNRNGKLENFPDGPAPDDTGAVFRVDVHGNGVWDNPFYTPDDLADPLNRVFAYGVRNSFGIAIDPLTGDLWDSENGPSSYDEVNRLDPGANSGWEVIMGPDERDTGDVEDLWMAPGAFYVDPQFSWLRTVAPTSVAFPESPVAGCDNRYDLLVADSNCGQIYRFELNAQRNGIQLTDPAHRDRVADNSSARCSEELDPLIFAGGFGAITDLQSGPDGALYVVSGTFGAIYRIGPNAATLADLDDDGVGDSCDCDSGDAGSYSSPVEVPRLRVYGASSTTLAWNDQSPQNGPGTGHTVVSGDLAALRGTGEFSDACALFEGSPDAVETDPRADPDAGAAFYYLVRAGNGCGDGTYGDGSPNPDPRDLLDAAVPPACVP